MQGRDDDSGKNGRTNSKGSLLLQKTFSCPTSLCVTFAFRSFHSIIKLCPLELATHGRSSFVLHKISSFCRVILTLLVLSVMPPPRSRRMTRIRTKSDPKGSAVTSAAHTDNLTSTSSAGNWMMMMIICLSSHLMFDFISFLVSRVLSIKSVPRSKRVVEWTSQSMASFLLFRKVVLLTESVCVCVFLKEVHWLSFAAWWLTRCVVCGVWGVSSTGAT